jgi:uncharacterized protein with von Willebrand factor type A (vWA) domain
MGGGGLTRLDTDVDLAALAATFGQLLHRAGVPVTPERSGRYAETIALTRPAAIDEVYWAGRVTLLSGQDQISIYDAVFDQVFRGMADVADQRGDTANPPPPNTRPGSDRHPGPSGRAGDSESSPAPPSAPQAAGEGAEAEDLLAMATAEERLHAKDFATLTPDELASIRAMITELHMAAPLRASRRRVRKHAGDRLDLRGTLRRAHRTGGDPVEQILLRRKQRPRRLVLITDISGSMEPYARVYLHLLYGAVRATRAEAFVFATRLSRLTRALATTNPDMALRQAAAAAPDWSGGTRIGAALTAFNDRYGRRGVARGAVVVIVSDGWECDDPAILGEQMARLSRLAYRIVWVNPRAASDHYEPLVGGMAAALPHIDAFVSGHSLAALHAVVDAIRDS